MVADPAGSARAIVRYDRLSHRLVQLGRKDTAEDIHCTAGAEWHDDAYRLAGIFLRECELSRAGNYEREKKVFHVAAPIRAR
ncbi:MAG: hypothetical protein A3G24_22930 [Betaproteobacteria bacterium RIFCSPLOWO2_12_FULL_62_13]|nr:MAG: hypothetical protein A3G24_22930 [Betaproteobacteria bacterium RIFCSPLOWO2_12_FULL_62_13]